jgi:hypothetical protein
VRARVAALRTEAESRVEDARTRLAEERRRLDARLQALTGGLGVVVPLPRG